MAGPGERVRWWGLPGLGFGKSFFVQHLRRNSNIPENRVRGHVIIFPAGTCLSATPRLIHAVRGATR
jgi:hypothetical protein